MESKNRAFVFSGIALLLTIPALILAASFVSMLKTGDTATTVALRSDTTFYAYKNIRMLFTRTACNAVKAYGSNTSLVAEHMNTKFKPHILNIFSPGAGFNVTFGGDFNATYSAANNRVTVSASNISRGVAITVTDLNAMTNYTGELGPEEYPLQCEYEIKSTPAPARDTTPPVITINYPGNRTYCPESGANFNVSVNIGVDEPVSWIKYCIASPSSAACGSNKTYNGTATETLAVNSTYRLDAYANDTSGNIGSASVYFLGTTFRYVSSYVNTSGNVTNFNNAKSATDGGLYAAITETLGYNKTGQPENPASYFNTGSGLWSSTVSGSVTQGWSSTGGNGYIYSAINGKGKRGDGTWSADFGYSFTNLSSVTFSIAREVPTCIRPDAAGTNNFTVKLVKPDNTETALLSQTFCTSNGNTAGWQTYVNNVGIGEFTQNGTYYIKIITYLKTSTTQSGTIQINYDNVSLTFSSPMGMRYEVEFATSSVPYPANNHYVEINYSMPVGETETAKIYLWSGTGWVFHDALINTPTPTLFTTFLSSAEYNSGTVRVKYEDETVGDDIPSSVYIDYHRVC